MSVLEDLILENFFNFLWKLIKLIGSFIRLPFVAKRYSLEQLSSQNLSGFIGLMFLITTTALVLFVN